MIDTLKPFTKEEIQNQERISETKFFDMAVHDHLNTPERRLNARWDKFLAGLVREYRYACNNCRVAEQGYRLKEAEARSARQRFGLSKRNPVPDVNSIFPTDADFEQFIISKPYRIKQGKSTSEKIGILSGQGELKVQGKRATWYLDFRCDSCRVGGGSIECDQEIAEQQAKKHDLRLEY